MQYIIIIAIVILLFIWWLHYCAKWRRKKERELGLKYQKRMEELSDMMAQTNALTRDDWRVNDNCN